MNPYIGDNVMEHMNNIMKKLFTPDELAEIDSEISDKINMNNSPLGESWSSYRKRAFTSEELATSECKVEAERMIIMDKDLSPIATGILAGLTEALKDAKGNDVPGIKKTTVYSTE